jgi:hypothetical protein
VLVLAIQRNNFQDRFDTELESFMPIGIQYRRRDLYVCIRDVVELTTRNNPCSHICRGISVRS